MNKLDYNTARYEFYLWHDSHGRTFSSTLYDLIPKADIDNRHRIAIGFPHHVKVWMDWMTSDSPHDYLEACKNALKEEDNDVKEII